MIADGFIAVHATLCKGSAERDAIIKKQADQQPVAQRLMTIRGVGSVVSLGFIAFLMIQRGSERRPMSAPSSD
ncbi:hypothetical protein AB2B41_21240 [Marimonas sp. MJW-29]|uniref:Uncharacterized protein n=1 Tax=Sulfitobacter sediminis TaxID=3234186 RepID=A0ABV3RTD3_9RHOB